MATTSEQKLAFKKAPIVWTRSGVGWSVLVGGACQF
jgi:hypothetical protein